MTQTAASALTNEQFKAAVSTLVAVAGTVSEIRSLEEFRAAGQMLVQCRAQQNALKERKTAIGAGARQVLTEVGELFDPPLRDLEALEDRLKALACDFVDTRMVSALVDAQQALVAGTLSGTSAMRAIPTLPGVSFKTTVEFSVEDESLVPSEYFHPRELNSKRILTQLRAGVVIPGIRATEKVTAAVSNG